APQCHHRLKLLGNDCLASVGAQVWDRQVEQHREVDLLKTRFDGIAETDVDGHVNSRTSQRCCRLKSKSAVFEFFSDRTDAKCFAVEFDSVFSVDRADFFPDRADGFRRRIAESEQIQVSSGTMRIVEPSRNEHRPFESEATSMLRDAESI